MFAKGVVSKVTDAFVRRVGDVASSPTLASDREAEGQSGRETQEPGHATDTKEKAPVPNEGLGATVSVGGQAGAEAAEDGLHTSERHRERWSQRHTDSGAQRATQRGGHREGHRAPPLSDTLADNLVFGASSWLLNTTASVVGVPLRVVPSTSTAAGGDSTEPNAAKIAVAEKEEATRLALRRMPRPELIKELQVLERRVAALKSALREQPAAPRPPSERW